MGLTAFGALQWEWSPGEPEPPVHLPSGGTMTMREIVMPWQGVAAILAGLVLVGTSLFVGRNRSDEIA